MPEAQVNGVTLSYELAGRKDGPVMMFSNSLGTDRGMWDGQVEAFGASWRILRYDTRGHGGSELTEGPYTADLLADDAIALMDHLGIDKVHFCGLSLGGLTGQMIGLKAPERLLSLTLANTAAQFMTPEIWNQRIQMVSEGGMAAIADATMERWFTEGFRQREPGAIERMHAMLSAVPKEGYIACSCAVRDADTRAAIAGIAVPTQVIAGAQDMATPPEKGRYIADTIPEAGFVLIDPAGHISNIEQPDVFNKALSDLLARAAA
ncbi:MAG: 3-oxoadipate enol-lactonase [Alphaproteobacteria bacterium]|nr:3-oxoadipate enol-lactonase [Alphaproteobacteria bacterium]